MHVWRCFFFTLLFTGFCAGVPAAEHPITEKGKWFEGTLSFYMGLDFDDSEWPEIRLTDAPQTAGFVWYRIRPELPAELSGRPLVLDLATLSGEKVSVFWDKHELSPLGNRNESRRYLLWRPLTAAGKHLLAFRTKDGAPGARPPVLRPAELAEYWQTELIRHQGNEDDEVYPRFFFSFRDLGQTGLEFLDLTVRITDHTGKTIVALEKQLPVMLDITCLDYQLDRHDPGSYTMTVVLKANTGQSLTLTQSFVLTPKP